MRILLLQPPFTQLNAPYPAVHYLDRFLRDLGHTIQVQDHSIGLYRRMMTKAGVQRLFADARTLLTERGEPPAEAREQLARYFSYRDRYAAWTEPLVRFLSAGDPALAVRLSRVPDDLPLGQRAQGFLDQNEGILRPEDAPVLAIHILDDLGDFISYALDPDFGTVRYAERISASRAEYGPVSETAESGYLMRAFYRPWLRETFGAVPRDAAPDLLLITVPFPGCLVGAVAAAREARAAFGPGLRIALGGGYVSTELRSLRDASIFDDVDALCFDAGYGALVSILEGMEAEREARPAPVPYRTARRAPDGAVVYSGFPPDGEDESSVTAYDASGKPSGAEVRGEPCPDSERLFALEETAVRSVFPDYRNAELALYIRAPSSPNPMHRLWSDAPWLKYHLAYGCYWRRCAFCDTQLDYVRRYIPSDAKALMAAASDASERSGLSGIHFTDEALPLPNLLEFARLNRGRDRPFTFWGNVRFDRVWTDDRCALLAASGLTAVSGGIEIATERGLALTGKGFTFPDLVRALAAFKRSGILVHGYLIYGFPEQTEQDLVDSAEAVRQLFAAGLLDSAFWHRFVLTRHSRMYGEWREGKRAYLEPVDRGWSFASNDLEFRGSAQWDAYDEPLERLLSLWMSGEEILRPVGPLRKGGAKPSLASGWVAGLLKRSEPESNAAPPDTKARVYWIAGLPAVEAYGKAGRARVLWTDRGAEEGLTLPSPQAARLAEAITDLAGNPDGRSLAEFLARTGPVAEPSSAETRHSESSVFPFLRENGLVVI